MLVSRVRMRRRSSSRSAAGGWSSSPPSSRWVAVQALVGLSVLAVLSTGCQSNPKPPPLESASSSSATPTPSPTEAAPTLPAEAKGTSEAAAKAFVRHYFDALNHGMNTGDTQYLRSLGSAGCESCEAIATNIEETYDAGGKITSRGWVVQSLSVVPRQSRTRPIIDLGVLMSPERVVESEGAPPRDFEGGKQPMTMYLVRTASKWQVARLDQVS